MPGQAEDRPGRDGDKDLNLAHLRGGRSQVAGAAQSEGLAFGCVGDCRDRQAHKRTGARSMWCSSAQLRTLLSAVLQPASEQPDNSQVSSLSRSWLEGPMAAGMGFEVRKPRGAAKSIGRAAHSTSPRDWFWSKV